MSWENHDMEQIDTTGHHETVEESQESLIELQKLRIESLQAENKRLKEALQGWIDVNEGAPNKYEWAEQALKDKQ